MVAASRRPALYCCCCSIFFFKQKTAYEMRISDWSSDVCSSDLVQQAHVHQRRRLLEPGGDGAVGGAGFGAATGMVVADDERRGVVRQRPAHDQIGRASCRERVRQYV